MNITLLLGNGFDKAIGLPTSYPEFYDWYLKKDNRTESETKLKLSIQKSIDNGDENWSDFEYALGQFTAEFEDKNEYIECFNLARDSLMEYLDEVYRNAKESSQDFIRSAVYCLADYSLKFYKDLKEKERFESCINNVDINVSYISFNYTPLFHDEQEQVDNNLRNHWVQNHPGVNYRCELVDCINVHGLINKNPILGVNDVLLCWRR